MDKNSLNIPIAIVITGLFIASAIVITNKGISFGNNDKEETTQNDPVAPSPVSKDDHILGSPNAKLVLVEYSDFECPFCKEFHKTMNQLVEEYAKDGQFSWVYRHFPIDSIHPKAKVEAHASECVAEIAGNDAFWEFTNRFFAVSPSNNQTDLAVLEQIVKEQGIDPAKFNECQESGRYYEKINKEFQEAIDTGGTGTPWSIIIASDGSLYPVNGAQPYLVMKEIIDTLLR